MAGGVISYGPHYLEQYRQGSGHVDRILKGEKPADLPVQTPTRFELVPNMKSAKASGLDLPCRRRSSLLPTRSLNEMMALHFAVRQDAPARWPSSQRAYFGCTF
jgi:ABC-type uncharacterized transport system substrate-binding protein